MLTTNIKYMDIKEFLDEGYLREVNRQFFHPLGLALEVLIDEDDKHTISGIWDYREDPEGMLFGDDLYDDEEKLQKALKIKKDRDDKIHYRHVNLGYGVQFEDKIENTS